MHTSLSDVRKILRSSHEVVVVMQDDKAPESGTSTDQEIDAGQDPVRAAASSSQENAAGGMVGLRRRRNGDTGESLAAV